MLLKNPRECLYNICFVLPGECISTFAITIITVITGFVNKHRAIYRSFSCSVEIYVDAICAKRCFAPRELTIRYTGITKHESQPKE